MTDTEKLELIRSLLEYPDHPEWYIVDLGDTKIDPVSFD